MTIKPLTGMTAASAMTGAELFYAQQAGADVKVVAKQFSAQHLLATNYGVKADGVTDDTSALQSAFTAVVAAGGTLELPSGICVVTSTLTLTPGSITTISIIGQGMMPGGTEFLWLGASTTTPLIRIQNLQHSVFVGFKIQCTATNPLAVGIQSEAGSAGNTGTNRYQNILMNGTTSALDKGFAFVEGSGGIDAGNDTSTFDDVYIGNFATAGWSFEHGESKGHNFFGCHFNAQSGTGLYGVTTALGTSNEGGSFCWYGGTGSWAHGADFYIGQPNDVIIIHGFNSESANRFIDSPSAIWNAAGSPAFITGNRWANDQLNADGFAINYWSGGPLILIGNEMGKATGKALKIFQGGGPSYGISIGNEYTSTDAAVLTGNSGQPFHWQSFMDFKNNNGTVSLLVLEQIVNQQLYSTNSSTSASTLLVAADISGGSIEHTLNLTGAISAASNAQLPTVTNLLATLGITNLTVKTNQTYKLRIINSAGTGSGIWTVTTNTGWTLNGTMTIAVGATRDFYVTITDPLSSITATLQSIGTGTK